MSSDYFFCPRVSCPAHTLNLPNRSWCYRHGYHLTNAFGRVQRYRCRHCGKTFSDQTFLLNYWLKKPTDFHSLGRDINSSASSNFVARHHHLSADSMRIRHDRLARNALYLQSLLTEHLQIIEPLVADGLESYVDSQYFPVNLNILIGSISQFVYFFTESHSRRKGTTTEKQKQRMREIYADKSFAGSRISTMLRTLLEYTIGRCPTKELTLRTDEHPVYEQVIKRWNGSERRGLKIKHEVTVSTEPRTMSNPLFAANYFDRLIRKDLPNHRRETVCQARNDRNLLSRFVYYVVTHNFYKPYRISSKAKQRRATHAGCILECTEGEREWKSRMHTYRFFRSFVKLPKYYEAVWFRRTATPLKREADPVPRFAYQ